MEDLFKSNPKDEEKYIYLVENNEFQAFKDDIEASNQVNHAIRIT